MSEKDLNKKRKRNQYILGIILIIVMFGSVFGVVVDFFNSENNSSTELNYKGYPLINENNVYLLTIGEKTFYFSTNPNEASKFKEINMTITIPSFVGVPVYIDSKEYFSTQEIYQNIYGYPERIQPACIDEKDCTDSSLPIKNCENYVVVVREAQENKIYERENCIFIEATNDDLPLVVDAFLLKLLGLN